MQEIEEDIWSLWPLGWAVITTNQGWKSNGENVMGAGLALQASKQFGGLAKEYGAYCQALKEKSSIWYYDRHRLIMFPTKPLNPEQPHLSWKHNASLELIETGLQRLKFTSKRPVFVPILGTLNGKLNKDDVLPLMRKYLTDDRFTIVHPVQKTDPHPF